jgi:hypothetical protein
MSAKRSTIGVRALQKRCADLVTSVRNRALASELELTSLAPGGERNPGRTIDEWLYYFAVLHRFLEREQIAAGRSVRPDQRKGDRAAGATDAFDLLADIGGVGERVDLRIPVDEGRVTSLTVEPKGMLALVEIHELDRDCRWLGARLSVLQEVEDDGLATPNDLQAMSDCARRIAEYVARIVWILTTPGAWCPYDPSRDAEPSAPAHLKDLDLLDLTRILMAHRRINGDADAALALYLPSRSAEKAPPMTWSVFYAATSREINVDSEVLLKHWSRKKVIVQAVLAAKARMDAEALAAARAPAA